ncbi:hypothetical protein ACO0QE_002801 [Hanseniaspora vineae]
MSYSALQEAHVSYLTNSQGTVDPAGHGTSPRTPVLHSSHIFSSPISKLINFKKKPSNTLSSSVASSPSASPQPHRSNSATPKKIARLNDDYIFGSPKPAQKMPSQNQNVRENLHSRAEQIIYTPQQRMFNPSPKRPPPPRPVAVDTFKENFFPLSDLQSAQTPSTISSKERQNETAKKRYVNEECCLCFEKLSTRSKNEKVFGARCGHVVHEGCLLLFIESNVESEQNASSSSSNAQRDNLFPFPTGVSRLDSSFQDNLVSHLLLSSKDYKKNGDPYFFSQKSQPPRLQDTLVQVVPPVPQRKYTSVISPIVQGQCPPYLSRYSSQKSKKSFKSLNSPKPITRKVAATTPTLVSSRIRTSAALINQKKNTTTTSTVVGSYDDDDKDEELEIIHIDDVHKLKPLAESVRQVVPRKIKSPPKSLIIVLQLDSHKKITFAENISIVNSLKALDMWYRIMNKKGQRLSSQYGEDDGVLWSVKLCCVDDMGKVLSSGHVSDVLQQLGSSPGLRFSQIRGKTLTSDYWDRALIQRYYQDFDSPIEVCMISNCGEPSGGAFLDRNSNIMMWDNFFTLSRETLCKIHIGYLNEDIDDELIEINSWLEIMELLCAYYGFEFGQDFGDL